jgi:hypothetical protein
MATGEEAIKTLKASVNRQKATREATAKVAADIATGKESQTTQTTSTEVTQ